MKFKEHIVDKCMLEGSSKKINVLVSPYGINNTLGYW